MANRWPIVCPSSPQERTIPQVRHRPAKALGSSGPPKTAVERRRRQVSPHTPRRVRVGVRAHQVLRIHLGRGPRAPEQACAHPLVHFCDAGHFWSVFGHRRDPWQHSRPHRASSAWPRAAISGADVISFSRFEQTGATRAAASRWRGTRAIAALARFLRDFIAIDQMTVRLIIQD